MASYPGAAVTFPVRTNGQIIDASHIDALQDEIAALEAALLTSGLAHAVWGTQAMTMTGSISPAQITATQNDYAPAGLTTAFLLRLTSDAARILTGVSAQTAGRLLVLSNANTSAFTLTLNHQDAGSAAANRIECPNATSLVLSKGSSAWLWYDTTSSFWRVLAVSAAAGGNVQFPAVQVPSGDANNLDDYEEGAWTPVLEGDAGSGHTYSSQIGYYVKVGRSITVTFRIALTALGTLSGTTRVTGLPYSQTANATIGFPQAGMVYSALTTALIAMNGILGLDTADKISLTKLTVAAVANTTRLTVADLSATSTIGGVLTYIANQ